MTPLLQEWAIATDYIAIDLTALTLLIVAALLAVTIRDLLAASVMQGIFSLVMAMLYLLLDAPDVALTEAAVGAGISTVLFLCTLAFTEREERVHSRAHSIVPLLVVVVTGSALIYATSGLPPFAAETAPIHHHVAPYYIDHMKTDIDIPNLVTAILASYRGFDTMGEVGVIFTAGIAIFALLMNLPQVRRTPHTPNTGIHIETVEQDTPPDHKGEKE